MDGGIERSHTVSLQIKVFHSLIKASLITANDHVVGKTWSGPQTSETWPILFLHISPVSQCNQSPSASACLTANANNPSERPHRLPNTLTLFSTFTLHVKKLTNYSYTHKLRYRGEKKLLAEFLARFCMWMWRTAGTHFWCQVIERTLSSRPTLKVKYFSQGPNGEVPRLQLLTRRLSYNWVL